MSLACKPQPIVDKVGILSRYLSLKAELLLSQHQTLQSLMSFFFSFFSSPVVWGEKGEKKKGAGKPLMPVLKPLRAILEDFW